MARVALGIASAVLFLVAVSAQPVEARSDWRSVPLHGGDIRSLAFAVEDPDLVLAGTSSGQVYLSRDGGRTWDLPGPRVTLPGWVISDLAFDPHVEGRVWAALWSMWGSAGAVVRSDDLGRNWIAETNGLPDAQVYRVALVPDRPGWIYAATRMGVWGSRDEGASWRELTGALPDIGKISSLLVDPRDPNVVYAGSWQRAFRSDDRGDSWQGIFTGMVLDSEVFSIRPGLDDPGDLWASTCGWVYRGENRGGRWQRYQNGLDERRTQSFEVLPSGRLVAGTVAGVYTSDDRGERWTRRTGDDLAIAEISFHPRRPGRVLVGTEGAGVWRSDDGGATFVDSAEGMTSLRVTDLETVEGTVFLAVRHAGMVSGIHRTDPLDLTLAAENPSLPTVLDIAVQGSRMFAATVRGLYGRASAWHRVETLGEARVEEVATSAAGVAARTAEAVWVERDGVFVRLPDRAGAPKRIQWVGGELWVTDTIGIYSPQRGPIPAPPGATQLLVLGAKSLWSGGEGVWLSGSPTGEPPWQRLAKRPARALATGNAAYPVLFLGPDQEAMLYAPDMHQISLELPVESRDVSAAVLAGNRIFVGTPGNGLLYADLLRID